jgi:hypothetical protein
MGGQKRASMKCRERDASADGGADEDIPLAETLPLLPERGELFGVDVRHGGL